MVVVVVVVGVVFLPKDKVLVLLFSPPAAHLLIKLPSKPPTGFSGCRDQRGQRGHLNRGPK